MSAVILNTTRSAKARWKYDPTKKVLFNQKIEFGLNEFLNSDHPDREMVIGYLTDKGFYKAEDQQDESCDICGIEIPAGVDPAHAISRFFGSVTKGEARRYRKDLRTQGWPQYSGLPRRVA